MTCTLLVKLRDRPSPATSLDKKIPLQVFCCDFYESLRIPLLENTSKPLFLLQWKLVLKHNYSQYTMRYFSNKKTEAIARRCSCEKEKFRKTHWNTYVPEFLFNKVTGWTLQLYLKKTLAQAFSCEFCKNFKNTFFYRTPLLTASKRGNLFGTFPVSLCWGSQSRDLKMFVGNTSCNLQHVFEQIYKK